MTEEHQRMVADCIKRKSRLTEWEHHFIFKLNMWGSEYKMSEKQTKILDDIWERVT